MPAPSRQLQIVNRGRDVITLELSVLGSDGKPERTSGGRLKKEVIVIGSADDRGVVGCTQPEITIDSAKWDRLLTQKAIAGLVEQRKLAVYAAA